MTFRRCLVTLLTATVACAPTAALADERSNAIPLGMGEANAFALELAAGSGLLGMTSFGLAEAVQNREPKLTFTWSMPIYGWAACGGVGGAGTGLGLALFIDRQPSWIGAAGATLTGVAATTGGLLWMNRMAAQTVPNDVGYALLGITLPFLSSMISSLTYQGLRWLTAPRPAPTPTPLETPWPSPSPPVRLFM